MHKLATLTLALLLSSCASYSGRDLVVGDSGYDDVISVMGPPALEWTDAAGSRQLAYPRGPMGVHTYRIDPQPRSSWMDQSCRPSAPAHTQSTLAA